MSEERGAGATTAPTREPRRIRTLAVGVCRHGDRILVERGRDSVKGQRFFRAIGGGVEFGERAADAVRREWREELDLDVHVLALLGVLESIFTYEGRAGHEVVFAFDVRVTDGRAHERDELHSTDDEGVLHEAVWVSLGELAAGTTPLHPQGLRELLRRGE